MSEPHIVSEPNQLDLYRRVQMLEAELASANEYIGILKEQLDDQSRYATEYFEERNAANEELVEAKEREKGYIKAAINAVKDMTKMRYRYDAMMDDFEQVALIAEIFIENMKPNHRDKVRAVLERLRKGAKS